MKHLLQEIRSEYAGYGYNSRFRTNSFRNGTFRFRNEFQLLSQKYHQQLQSAMDLCLEIEPYAIDTALFNQFLRAMFLVTFPIDSSSLMRIDEFYIKAHGLGFPFDTVTFNQLLKAVRLSQPEINGGLVAAYLDEMQLMSILPNSVTINELLCMAARNPNHLSYDRMHSNKWVADQYFKYFLDYLLNDHHYLHRRQCNGISVLNSYLNVYAESGDVQGMIKVLHMAKGANMRLNVGFEDTFRKGLNKWNKNEGRSCNTTTISIFDYITL